MVPLAFLLATLRVFLGTVLMLHPVQRRDLLVLPICRGLLVLPKRCDLLVLPIRCSLLVLPKRRRFLFVLSNRHSFLLDLLNRRRFLLVLSNRCSFVLPNRCRRLLVLSNRHSFVLPNRCRILILPNRAGAALSSQPAAASSASSQTEAAPSSQTGGASSSQTTAASSFSQTAVASSSSQTGMASSSQSAAASSSLQSAIASSSRSVLPNSDSLKPLRLLLRTSLPRDWERLDDQVPPPRGWTIPVDFEATILWPSNAVLIALGTKYLPRPHPPNHTHVYVCEDGLWGEHEYTLVPQPFDHVAPHLACLPVASSASARNHVLFRRVDNRDMTHSKEPGKMHLFVLTRECREELEKAVKKDQESLSNVQRFLARVFGKNIDWETKPEKQALRAELFKWFRMPHPVFTMAKDAVKAVTTDGTSSRAEFLLQWRAMQRGVREMVAVIDFCEKFIPCPVARKEIGETCFLIPGMERRGTILSGKDLKRFIGVFMERGVAVYGVLWRDEWWFNENDWHWGDASESRCSVMVEQGLNCVSRKTVPVFCLPPQGVRWCFLEKVAHAPQKKHKVVEKKRGLSSQERYEGFTSTNPAFIRHLSTICVPRPHYMMGPTDEYVRAQRRALEHLDLLRDRQGHLASFLPPTHLFYGLLPTLLQRIQLTRSDPTIEGFESRTGWAEDAWSGPMEVNLEKRRKWLKAFLHFFVFAADAECNKAIDKLGWTTIAELSHKLNLILSMDHDRMDNLEQELTDRYFLMCLMVGDWPAEILEQQTRANFAVMCMNHWTVVVDNLDDLYDLSDEDED
ncbi:hypothetical protein K488DRAFT_73633 [Vararia minispora EC-137]|uniref:Uncharacterized protein n=1 Tax=Vararia minispora EC-137 TaxID=1314806 RepID=A0ACB8QAN0_9AGAM|nr:hypothetical protein K488DRAFT_73633 [Vararia minispora EC-137]